MMSYSTIVYVVTSLMVLCGALFMLAAVMAGQKMKRHIPDALHGRWGFMTTLMQFFLVGYLMFLIILISKFTIPTELITAPVFLGGAIFVFIVIKLTQETVRKIRQAEERLQVLNESLEQRVIERTLELDRLNESLERRVADRTQDLDQSREFLQTVLDSMNDEVLIIDVDNFSILRANAAFQERHGVREEAIIGKKCYKITHNRQDICQPPDDICPLVEAVKTGRFATAEHTHSDARGKQYVEVSTSPIRDTDGRISRIDHVTRDITERKRAAERIEHLALYDTLTGLPNRMLFFDRLNQVLAVAKRNRNIFALLFMDVDDFKDINDTFGHEGGDHVLRDVAELMVSNVRKLDTIARMGGDEFIGISGMIKSPDDAVIVAEKILASLSEPFDLKGHRRSIGMSIGISIYPLDGDDAETLLRKADEAMYRVKKSGKGHYLRYLAT
jgi:diguanylate cyclase (GGDEF)-like protein/PAS domain S-box-containing protein